MRVFVFLVCCVFSFCGSLRNLTPVDYGFHEAKSDLERYEVLMRTHKEAVERGVGVTYKGIKEIHIEIPQQGDPIPLPDNTDFAGAKIVVRNTSKKTALFERTHELQEIQLSKKQLQSGRFRDCFELRWGKRLLVVEDQKKWVEKRRGYNNGTVRKDILLLNGGLAENSVIASYNDEASNPKFLWCKVTKRRKEFKNLIFERTADSDKITYLFSISNENNILVKKVTINTPSNTGMYGDAVLKFENCTNVTVEDVVINGTYSLVDKYGYGIGMNNVWNSTFVRLKADAAWGIFGNNNISQVVLEDCDINRFDIHCYGKDVCCQKTVFRNMYNQFSSFYGTLRFEDCRFINFVPVLFESSYSAYTFFELEFENCYIEVAKDRPYLIKAGNPSLLADNPRNEFAKASWPNVKIKNLTLTLPKDIKKWTLFYAMGENEIRISGISEITIDGLIIDPKSTSPNVYLSNKKVRYDKQLNIQLSNSTVSNINGVE